MEWIYVLTAFLAGLAPARAALGGQGRTPVLVSAAALGYGVGFQTILFIVMVLVRHHLTMGLIIGCQLAMAGVLLGLSLWRRRGTAREWLTHLAVLVLILLVDFLFSRYNIVNFTPDSIYTHYNTLKIVTHGGFTFGLAPNVLSAFPISGAGMHYPAVVAGSEYFAGVYQTLTFALALALASFSARVLVDFGVDRRAALFTGLAVAVVALGSGQMVWMSIYFNNHIHSALLFVIAGAGFWSVSRGEGTGGVFGAALALALFTFDRMEGVVFGLAALVVLKAALPEEHERSYRWALALFAALSVPWQMYLAGISGGADAALVGSGQFYGMAAILAATAALALVLPDRWGVWLGARIEWVVSGGLLLLIAAFFVIKPGHMAQGTLAALTNWFAKGYWTGVWWLLVGGSAWVWVRRRGAGLARDRALDAVFFCFLTYALLVLAFNGVRIARDVYLVGYGNSSNRMMTHIVPLGLVWLGVNACLLSRQAVQRLGLSSRVAAFCDGLRLPTGRAALRWWLAGWIFVAVMADGLLFGPRSWWAFGSNSPFAWAKPGLSQFFGGRHSL